MTTRDKAGTWPMAITKSGKGPWYDWLESEEGKQATKPDICLIGHQRSQYLENRLWLAFTAGMKAGFEQAKEANRG